MSSLLPNAKQKFYGLTGSPLAGGNVYYYVPGTTTPKSTYQDEALTIPNTNPIVLDARGECVAWGTGDYRQVVYSSTGILVWDQVTSDPSYSPNQAVNQLRSDLANTTDVTLGDALIGVMQPGTGAVARTQHQKNAENLSSKDYGVVGDRTTDDTTHIVNVITAKSTTKPVAEVTSYSNDYYANLPDMIVEDGDHVMNPQHDRLARVFGEEYLQAFHLKFSGEASVNTSTTITPKTVVYSGDSTVLGVGANPNRDPCTLLQYSSYDRGYAKVTVLNHGQSGHTTEDWNATFAAVDIASNPDLLILRWGINDPFYGYGLSDFKSALRGGLAQVRASRSISQTAIVLMTPSPTNDKATGRDEVWHEHLNGIVRAAARDYQCCFIDTYSYFQDAHNGATYMDTQPNGSHVHPLDILYEKMNRILADVVFPPQYIYGRTNVFYNYEATSGPNGTTNDAVTGRLCGLTNERNDGSAASGLNGQLITLRGVNQTGLQIAHALPGSTPGTGIRLRTYFNGTYGSGGTYIGTPTNVTFLNGWANYGSGFAPARFQVDLSGRVFLEGLIKPGTTTDGTAVLSVPSWAAPQAGKHICRLLGETNSVTATVQAGGQLTFTGAGASGTWISLQGLSWAIDL